MTTGHRDPRRASPARPGRGGRRVVRASARAFSLLELVIVASIIGIAAAIAVPRIASASSRYGVQAAAYRVALELDRAAELARATGTPHTVVFRNSADAFGVFEGMGASIASTPLRTLSVVDEPYRCGISAQFIRTTDRIAYDGFGQSQNGGYIIVTRGDYLVALMANTGSSTTLVGSLQFRRADNASAIPTAMSASIAEAVPLGVRK